MGGGPATSRAKDFGARRGWAQRSGGRCEGGTVNTFIEISKSEHGHGGRGWEFGTCLWSPSRNRAGADRYSIMRMPKAGDRVIHVYECDFQEKMDTYILGESQVRKGVEEIASEPPSPGLWAGMAPYYRIDLTDYHQYEAPLPIRQFRDDYQDEIRVDLLHNQPSFYPFNTYGNGIRLVQGIYLARSTEALSRLLEEAIGIESADRSSAGWQEHQEYTETRRTARERFFFARNPKLARQAKQRAGYRCEACGFHFTDRYGVLGHEYLEAHHLDALADRPELEWTNEVQTSLERVVAVCSNCHRMLHRRKPPLSLDELREALRSAGLPSPDKSLA